jgi:SAM-dependent methyltransferase
MVGVDRVGEMLHRVPPIMRPAVMDASRLALHSEAFDVAFCAFVLFFVPDPIAALRELRRVVVPGGAVGFTSWGDEPVYPAWQAWNEELTRVGLAPSPSLRHDQLNTVEKVATALDAAGLVAGRVWARRVDIPADADGFLQRMLAFGGRRRLAALSRTKRKCCLDRIRRRLADLEPADLSDRSEVIYAVGRRPGR